MSDGTSTPTAEQRLSQLARLRDLWLENRSTRQFVQIAEELRRLGDAESAASLLEVGLESHPRYLSAQVALARCRVELGQAEAARGLLESVVEVDSTHPLATRLLVEAYVGVGDAASAREKLELYRLLNPGDPQIEQLEASVGELESALVGPVGEEVPSPPSLPMTAAEAPETDRDVGVEPVATGFATAREEAVASPGAESGGRRLSAPFGLAGEARAAATTWVRPRGLAAPFDWAPVPAPASTPTGSSERGFEAPFNLGSSAGPGGVVAADAADGEDLGEGSVEPAMLEAVAREAEAAEELPPELGTVMEQPAELASIGEPENEGAEEAPSMLAAADDWGGGEASEDADEPVAEQATEADTRAELVAEVEGWRDPESAEMSEASDLAEELPAPAESVAPAAREEVVIAEEAPMVAVTSVRTAGPLAVVGEDAAASASSLPAETTTLGQLYLRQGHSVEAERIFRRVLEREPANDTAREGLREAMIATDLARAGAGAPPRGITERKIHRLTGWVGRLRRS